jgi:hypothetical protein
MIASEKMDAAIRQNLQRALETAVANKATIVIVRADRTCLDIQYDLICYETRVEATATDGTWVVIPYEEIADVRVNPGPAEKSG